jgi:hypothetical protein
MLKVFRFFAPCVLFSAVAGAQSAATTASQSSPAASSSSVDTGLSSGAPSSNSSTQPEQYFEVVGLYAPVSLSSLHLNQSSGVKQLAVKPDGMLQGGQLMVG